MTKEQWLVARDFSPDEFGSEDMDEVLIFTIQQMRTYIKRKINVHSGFREGDPKWHGKKKAADIDIEGMNVIDQYLLAERFDKFNGIGVYPSWNRPGIHVDVRPHSKLSVDSRWGCFEVGVYVPLNYEFFRQVVGESKRNILI